MKQRQNRKNKKPLIQVPQYMYALALFVFILLSHSMAGVQYTEFPPAAFINDSTIVSPSPGSGDSLILIHGTESHKKITYQKNQLISSKKYSSKVNTQIQKNSQWPPPWFKFVQNKDSLYQWALLPTGFNINTEYLKTIRSFPNWLFRSKAEVEYTTRTHWLRYGGSLFIYGFSGALIDTITDKEPKAYERVGWSLTVGVPGISYRLLSAAWPIPEYSWLETSLYLDLIQNEKDGDVIQQYDKGTIDIDFNNNKAHLLNLHFSHFSYTLYLDGDVFTRGIHDFKLKKIPATFGSWGLGITGAGTSWVPGVSINLAEVSSKLPLGSMDPILFHLSMLQIEFYFHEINNYYIAISGTVQINDFIKKMMESKK